MAKAKINKINSLIKDELAKVIFAECDWTRLLLLSITEVDTAPDLEQCKVYISIFTQHADKKEVLARLIREGKHLRYVLASRINLRKMPYLRFILDESLEESERITNLIKTIS
jgi:ribosome-binding factor A